MTRLSLYLSIIFTMITAFAMGQRPTSVPHDNEPVRFFESPANIIFYIIIPLIIVFIYYLWRRRMAKEAEKERKEQQDNQ